jgi:hypothetical protein
MLLSYMPYNLLAASIAFTAPIVMAGPPFGTHFDSLARMVFERVSARHVFQLLW